MSPMVTSGFMVWGLGFKVSGLGFRIWGLGFRVCGLNLRGLRLVLSRPFCFLVGLIAQCKPQEHEKRY